jgi:hypothetical protein
MKKLIVLLVAVSLYQGVHSQTNGGDWLIGGNLRINTTKADNEFTFQPNLGYFFTRGFAAGSEFLVSFSRFGDEKSSSIGVGPFARYYFNLKNPAVKPLLHSSFNFASVTTRQNNIKNRNTVTSLLVAAGIAYFINDNVALETLAGYNRSKFENLDVEGGFAFRIGFQVHLLRREVPVNRRTNF